MSPRKKMEREASALIGKYVKFTKESQDLGAIQDRKRTLLGSEMAAGCSTLVMGSSLALAHYRDSKGNDTVSLQHLTNSQTPGISGLDQVLNTLKAMRRTTDYVKFRDATLVKLACDRLEPVQMGLESLDSAMQGIAKTIDYAAADNWMAGRSDRVKRQKEVTANTITPEPFETKVLIRKVKPTMQDEGEKLLAKDKSNVSPPPPTPSDAQDDDALSVLSIKSHMAAMMGNCVSASTPTTGYEVFGPLGGKSTRYKCTCCSTKLMPLIDFLTHCNTTGHRNRSNTIDSNGDTFLRAMRTHQTMAWMLDSTSKA
eukprot:TRINITY_DN1783_c0_g1_i3.p1 TRINITY_DN1783_c0_g1~~TRINITY_DN1783_c0_g1_i3.p1  ORF type:complete len:313 (+),score=45.86 TRINITY_DN1783_c0_g1_i3:127-1065(+)